MSGTEIVIFVAVIAIALVVGYALGRSAADTRVRAGGAQLAKSQDRIDLLTARVQALDAYRTAIMIDDPVMLTRTLLALRTLAQQRLDDLGPPSATEPSPGTPAARGKPPVRAAPLSAGAAPQPWIPAGELAEDLRAVLRHLNRTRGDGPTPYDGRTTTSLREQLRDVADRLDHAFADYLARTG